MNTPPRLARAVLRVLLPDDPIADSLEGDLAEEFARRARQSPARAAWWYRWAVLRLPYGALRREVRRLRRSRPGEHWSRGGRMDGWMMDLRVAARSLVRRPVFTAVALATIALSTGAATMLFSVVDGVLLSALPYEAPDQLVTVYLTSDEWRESDNELLRASWDVQTMELVYAEAFRSAAGPLQSVGAYASRVVSLDAGDGSVDEVTVVWVDEALFSVLGVAPATGRLPTVEELRGGAAVVVLRHDLWIDRFGGDPDVVGHTVRLGEQVVTVVGVMPSGFFLPTEDAGDLWSPVIAEARDAPSFYGIGRLSPGASLDDASAFLETVARRVSVEHPARGGMGGRAVRHEDSVVGSVRGGIELLFGTALLVLLVACANLANLFLVRTVGRREELAVRASLGAGAGSLRSTVLAEVLLLGSTGGLLGLAIAVGANRPFVDALASSLRGLPRQSDIAVDGSVLLFALLSTLSILAVAAVAPVLASSRGRPGAALGGMRRTGTGKAARQGQRLLLGVQGGFTVVLVLGAGLLARSFFEAARVDMGMAADRVAVVELASERGDAAHRARMHELYEEARQRIARHPGVHAVGLASSVPSTGGVLLQRVRAGLSADEPLSSVLTVGVGEGYFASLGIPLLSGRAIEAGDESGPVTRVVISEDLARQLFGRTDVAGTAMVMGAGDAEEAVEIVGVAGVTRQLSPFQAPAATMYYPLGVRGAPGVYLTVGADGDPRALLDAVRADLAGLDPALAVDQVTTLRTMLDDGMRHVRLRMILMASLAVLAAVLAMVGISGVVAHVLSEQTRDVGIRMALGAEGGREVRRVIRQALWPTCAGIAIGLLVARPLSAVMERFVFGVAPTDPATWLMVTALLVGASLLAAWLPARRAATVDPAQVLNQGA